MTRFEVCMTAESTTSPREDRIPWAAMAGTIATVTVFAVAQGLTYPLLSFILERQGTTPGLIGLSAAMTPLGFLYPRPSFRRWCGAWAGRGVRSCVDPGRAHPDRDCLEAGSLGLDAAALPARLLRQSASRDQQTWLISITPAPRRGRIMGLDPLIVSVASPSVRCRSAWSARRVGRPS